MPDISLCDNDKCPIRDKCYRYKAVPSPDWQSYTTFYPTKKMDGGKWECEWFMKIYPTRDKS